MKLTTIILLPQAQKDLDDIFEPLLSKIIQHLYSLRQFPEIGAPMIGPFAGYRSFVASNIFKIVYRILPSGVIEVAYIRNCRREPLTQ